MKFYKLIIVAVVIMGCARSVRKEAEGVAIVTELPSDKKCITVGEVEVKDMLESSAQNELKNSVEQLGGNFLIITNTKYTTSFVIHKAEGFNCK